MGTDLNALNPSPTVTMAQTKDLRRADLIIPYQEPEAKQDAQDMSSSLSSTLPMAAMFMRNKMIGWAALIVSIQNWLGESESAKKNAAMPGYLSVGMSFMALASTYMNLFIPQPGEECGGEEGTGFCTIYLRASRTTTRLYYRTYKIAPRRLMLAHSSIVLIVSGQVA